MGRVAVVLAVSLVLCACESDAEKLERLQADVVLKCYAADAQERFGNVNSDERTECTLAQRELARFMDGR